MPHDLVIHDFKVPDLKGGTLLVSLPNLGVGSVLLTDYLLEQAGMDHAASADSDRFPPMAMVHDGRPRFPVRIHADAQLRLAVMRSEVPVPFSLARDMARTTVAWAKRHGLARIVTLDAVGTRSDWKAGLLVVDEGGAGKPPAGAERLESGALGGVAGCLLLEARLQKFPVAALLATLRSAEDDVHSCLAFADALPAWVEGLRVDRAALERELKELETAIRSVQQQAERAMRTAMSDGQSPQDFV